MDTIWIIYVIAFFVILIFIIINGVNRERWQDLLIAVWFVCFALLGAHVAEKNYKQGQIDYHNGIIKYELKMNSDSTVVWEKIKTDKK